MIGFGEIPRDSEGEVIETYPVAVHANSQLLMARMTAILHAKPQHFIETLRADRDALRDYLAKLEECIDAHEQAKRGLN